MFFLRTCLRLNDLSMLLSKRCLSLPHFNVRVPLRIISTCHSYVLVVYNRCLLPDAELHPGPVLMSSTHLFWHSYWKWPNRNSEFSQETWWFSIVFCMFTRWYASGLHILSQNKHRRELLAMAHQLESKHLLWTNRWYGGWLRNPAPVVSTVVNIPFFCWGFNHPVGGAGFRWPIQSMLNH